MSAVACLSLILFNRRAPGEILLAHADGGGACHLRDGIQPNRGRLAFRVMQAHTVNVAPESWRNILLKMGRADFPAFYATASAVEVKQLDMAILLTALFLRQNRLRPGPTDETNLLIRVFAELRMEISGGVAFQALPDLEREKITRAIFDRVR